MPLFEVTVKATKTFYVEADSQREALEHEASQDEFDCRFSGDVEFEPDEMNARQCDEFDEKYAREREPKLILS